MLVFSFFRFFVSSCTWGEVCFAMPIDSFAVSSLCLSGEPGGFPFALTKLFLCARWSVEQRHSPGV